MSANIVLHSTSWHLLHVQLSIDNAFLIPNGFRNIMTIWVYDAAAASTTK